MAERAITHKSDKFAEPEAEPADVEAGWRHTVALHESQVGMKRALAAAERDWQAEPTEEAWDRIAEIQQRRAREIDAQGSGEG
jgi:DNA primase